MAAESLPHMPSRETSASNREAIRREGFSVSHLAESGFYWTTATFAGLILLTTVAIGFQLWRAAQPAISTFGLKFLTSSKWDPNADIYGAWPFIYGTLMSSFLALLIAVPIGIFTAIFLAELSPKRLRTPLSFMVELLAAVPSVVYGLWGVLVMVPWLREKQVFLNDHFGSNPLFAGAPMGYSMMAGGLILAIMILPFITAVSREVIKAVPSTQREAAFGLGATHWEAIKGPILKSARSGIIGAIILGLARALGETMAITMVIGNNNSQANISLLAPASTLSSALANQFAEASGQQVSALMYLALVLFGITIVVNAMARFLIWRMARDMGRAV